MLKSLGSSTQCPGIVSEISYLPTCQLWQIRRLYQWCFDPRLSNVFIIERGHTGQVGDNYIGWNGIGIGSWWHVCTLCPRLVIPCAYILDSSVLRFSFLPQSTSLFHWDHIYRVSPTHFWYIQHTTVMSSWMFFFFPAWFLSYLSATKRGVLNSILPRRGKKQNQDQSMLKCRTEQSEMFLNKWHSYEGWGAECIFIHSST